MEIKLPNGTGVVTNNHDCIEMYKKMGGIEVEEKPKKVDHQKNRLKMNSKGGNDK